MPPAVSSCECVGVVTHPDTALSSDASPLLAEVHEFLGSRQYQYERDTVDCFSSVTGKRQLDLLEVCAPWDSPLAEAVERHGGTVFRIGLHNGFDLGTRAGLLKAIFALKRLKPRYVHVSPPCFPFSTMQNANQNTPEQREALHMKRQAGRRILRNCCRLLEIQIQEMGAQGGMSHDEHDGGLEQPLRALSWKEPSLRRIVQLCGGRFRVDGCRHGSCDVHTGRSILKSYGWVSSNLGIRKAIQLSCNHPPHTHIPIEGRRTAASAIPKFCVIVLLGHS